VRFELYPAVVRERAVGERCQLGEFVV